MSLDDTTPARFDWPESASAAGGDQVRLAALDHGRGAVIAFNDPTEPALPVLCMDTAAGQISWHLHPDDVPLFSAIPVVDPSDHRARWDGHGKNAALARLRTLAGLDR